ncbi:MAG: hypothetical protein AAFQ43_03145 [Bacteroidota bacterium]
MGLGEEAGKTLGDAEFLGALACVVASAAAPAVQVLQQYKTAPSRESHLIASMTSGIGNRAWLALRTNVSSTST